MTQTSSPGRMAEELEHMYGFGAHRNVVNTEELQRTQEQLQAAFGDEVQPIPFDRAQHIRIPILGRRATRMLVHDVLQQGESGVTASDVIARMAEVAELKRYRSIALPMDTFRLSLDAPDGTEYTLSLRTRYKSDLDGIEEDRYLLAQAAYDVAHPPLDVLGTFGQAIGIKLAKVHGAKLADEIRQHRPMRAMMIPLGRLIIAR